MQVADASIANGRFDVMMLAYHHGIWPAMPEVIRRARAEQDMGIVAMKTLKGARHHGLAGFRQQADAYSQAALRWALSNDDVSAAIISFSEFQHLDEYLYASGGRTSDADLAILEEYDRQIAGSYCSPHCGVCLGSCPRRVGDPRRPAPPHVLRGLREPERGDATVRRAREERGSLRLLLGALCR